MTTITHMAILTIMITTVTEFQHQSMAIHMRFSMDQAPISTVNYLSWKDGTSMSGRSR